MREWIVDEPAVAEEEFESPPAARYWLHILLFALAFLSSTIVGARLHYNFQHDLPIFGAGEGAAGDASSGATLFADRCAGCHGHDGTGGGVGIRLYAFVRGASRPVDFTDARVMEKWPQERITLVIREGGEAVGASTLMPAYGDRLSKDEISDLVVFINSLRR